jgi:hypothetical protein
VTELPAQDQLQAVLAQLVTRNRPHSGATVQADIRLPLLTGGLGPEEHDLEVELEPPVPGPAGYVASRSEATRQRYISIVTGDADWRAYLLHGDELTETTHFELKSPSLSGLGRLQADAIAALELDEARSFITLRQRVRDALASHGAAEEVSDIVTEMLA